MVTKLKQTQDVTKLKNLIVKKLLKKLKLKKKKNCNWDKTQIVKTQIVIKLKCDKTQVVTKPKNLICNKEKLILTNLNYHKSQFMTKE